MPGARPRHLQKPGQQEQQQAIIVAGEHVAGFLPAPLDHMDGVVYGQRDFLAWLPWQR